MKESPINLFYTASEIRNAIKQIQQLSWTVTQFERKFPFTENLEVDDLKDFINAYIGFGEELTNVYNWYRKVINENPIAHDALINKTKDYAKRNRESGLD